MCTATAMFSRDIRTELRNIGQILKQLRQMGLRDNQVDPHTGYEANELMIYRSELLNELHNRRKQY